MSIASFQDIVTEVSSSYQDGNDALVRFLESVFLDDFPVGTWPYNLTAADAKNLALIRARNFMKLYSRSEEFQLHADRDRAGVSIDSMQALKNHEYPLPFGSLAEWLSHSRAIAGAVQKDAPALGKAFTLIYSGSGASFYSENPAKPDKFFNRDAIEGKRAGDIDVAIACNDLTQIKQHFGSKSPKYFGMWGTSATLEKFPSLRDFFMTWGNHPYEDIGAGNKKRFNRDIGIVTLSFDSKLASTHSKWWVKDFVYDAAIDNMRTNDIRRRAFAIPLPPIVPSAPSGIVCEICATPCRVYKSCSYCGCGPVTHHGRCCPSNPKAKR